MQIKFIFIFIIIVNNWCSGASVDTSARLKRLMSIDLSKLSNNNYKPLTASHNNYRPTTDSDQNKNQISKSVPKLLNIDLSALRTKQETPQTIATTAQPIPNSDLTLAKSQTKEEYHNLDDIHEFDGNRVGDDFEEYDYYQPLPIIPHSLYFNVWSPETPGYDALTDFFHDDYKIGRIVSNGKRDIDDYSSEWVDNTIPMFPEAVPVSDPCPYLLPEDYGLTCDQFTRLLNQPNGNSIYKRSMFISKGWGPSGSDLNLPSKLESNAKVLKANNLRKLLKFAKIESNIRNSHQGVRQKQDNKHKSNSHRWSVPHLFGLY